LRFTLRETSLWEPLGRELDALENYMAIQDARFGEDLVCTVACERRARQLLVPPMLIQPLVENALKYGADTGPRPLLVQVKVVIRDDVLVVEVANTGRWVVPDGRRGGGLGMRTLRTRLRMLYGSDASVAHETDKGWVCVSVRLPIDPSASPVPILVSGHEAVSP
jgi:LytS/YehU family sensor histidine kinase